jgi:hypothetical protein
VSSATLKRFRLCEAGVEKEKHEMEIKDDEF